MAFDPKFDVKMDAQATAKYLGPKDDNSLSDLISFFRKERWRGALVINWPGNGGVNDVVFTERKPAQMIEKENA